MKGVMQALLINPCQLIAIVVVAIINGMMLLKLAAFPRKGIQCVFRIPYHSLNKDMFFGKQYQQVFEWNIIVVDSLELFFKGRHIEQEEMQ